MEVHRVWDMGAVNGALMCWCRMEVGEDGNRMEDWTSWSHGTLALDQ